MPNSSGKGMGRVWGEVSGSSPNGEKIYLKKKKKKEVPKRVAQPRYMASMHKAPKPKGSRKRKDSSHLLESLNTNKIYKRLFSHSLQITQTED